MPTHTPSPYRFLASNAPPLQKAKPKAQTGLRNALQNPKAPQAHLEPGTEVPKITPAKRFVIPPSRPIKSNPTASLEPAAAIFSTPRPRPPRKFERVESIELSSQSSFTATQDEHNEPFILPSIEDVEPMFWPDDGSDAKREEEGGTEEMLFDTTPNKRRRLSSGTPQTPAPAHNPTTHRFRNPIIQTPAPFSHVLAETAASTLSTPAARPHFILPAPPTSPSKPSKPLPEIFSPSRRIGKHIPDGMANTMTSWIIEMANTAPDRGGSGQAASNREDGVKVKVRVKSIAAGEEYDKDGTACYPGGITFVRGETDPSLYNASRATSEHGEIRVVLTGTGNNKSKESIRLLKGSAVGIRAPIWDIDVGDEKWMVGLDWMIL